MKNHLFLRLLNKKRVRNNNIMDLKKEKEHGKFGVDNMMKKIKTHLMSYIY